MEPQMNTYLFPESASTTIKMIAFIVKGAAAEHKQKPLTDTDRNDFARGIGTLLFDLPARYSGKASKAVLQSKYHAGTKWCPEHFIPRQVSGHRILDTFLNERFDMKKLLVMLWDSTEVHYVLPEENTALMPHQKPGVFTTWEAAYDAVGIELVDWPKGTLIKKLPQIYPDLV
jgi:hypothetical protein